MPGTEIHIKAFVDPVVNEPMVENSKINSSIAETAVYDSEEAFSRNTDTLKANTALLGEFGDILPALVRNLAAMNMQVERNNQLVPARTTRTLLKSPEKTEATRNHEAMMNFFRSGNNAVGQLTSGNFGGAIVGAVNTGAQAANTASNLAKLGDLGTLAKGLAVAGGVLAAGGLAIAGADKLAQKYESNMSSIFGTGNAFGVTDNAGANRLYYNVNQFNRGTGLSDNDFNGVVQTLARQGMGGNGVEGAMNAAGVAQNLSRWAYATGGDVQNYARLAGTMSRYGGSKNVAEDMNYLMAAGKAQGLSTTQLPEFLDGIQKVMEEGIAKGFTRSATEVADTLTMISKMSGNDPFWSGEQGARRLQQINSGIAGATALAKSEDVLVYRAFNRAFNTEEKQRSALGKNYVEGGDYVNMMQLIEKGITKDTFAPLMETINETYGDDTAAKIEALRKMTGLNYTGAAGLLSLSANKNVTDAEIKAITSAPENQNNETRLADVMSKINSNLTYIGSSPFSAKIELMDGIASGLDSLVGHFVGKKSMPEIAEETIEKTAKELENVRKGNATITEGKPFVKNGMGTYDVPDAIDTVQFIKQFGGYKEGTKSFELLLGSEDFRTELYKRAKNDEQLDDTEIKELQVIMSNILRELQTGIKMYKTN